MANKSIDYYSKLNKLIRANDLYAATWEIAYDTAAVLVLRADWDKELLY